MSTDMQQGAVVGAGQNGVEVVEADEEAGSTIGREDLQKFSRDSFVMLIMRSAAIARMPQKKQDEMVWFLLNAEENVQKEFFQILLDEQMMMNAFDEEAKATQIKLWEEYIGQVNMEEQSIMRKIQRQKEASFRSDDKAHSEKLLKDL